MFSKNSKLIKTGKKRKIILLLKKDLNSHQEGLQSYSFYDLHFDIICETFTLLRNKFYKHLDKEKSHINSDKLAVVVISEIHHTSG